MREHLFSLKWRRVFLGACVCFFTSACNSEVGETSAGVKPNTLESDQTATLSPMLESMQRNIHGADFVAVIRQIKVEVLPLPDEDVSDDYSEEKHVFYADVLKAVKGDIKDNITYYMIVEKGEEATHNPTPMVVTLCEGKEGLYWPGVGSQFPYNAEVKAYLAKLKPGVKEQAHLTGSTLCN